LILKLQLWAVWIILFIFSIANMGFAGPWLWTRGVLDVGTGYSPNMEKLNTEFIEGKRVVGYFSIIPSNQYSVGIIMNWYFNRYVLFLNKQEADQTALNKLLGVTDGKKLFFSERIDYLLVPEFLQDANRFQDFENVVSYSGDRLVVNVHAPQAGFLSFIDNWDPDWKATVDGNPVPIDLLFGTFKSIYLKTGDHQVEFKYRPFFAR
jgi:hypothetical protein